MDKPDPIELRIDISDIMGFEADTAATVYLPAGTNAPMTALFAYPGGGFRREYFDVRQKPGYSQAAHTTDLGFAFIACDHPGIGGSSACDLFDLSIENMARANHATATRVIEIMRSGWLGKGLPPLELDKTIGIGHSMGGCTLVVQQATHKTFDAIAVLGWSAVQEVIPLREGGYSEQAGLPRDADLRSIFSQLPPDAGERADIFDEAKIAYMFHDLHDDGDMVDMTMKNLRLDPALLDQLPPWRAANVPPCAAVMVGRDAIAAEACQVDVPVLIGCGAIDCLPDPQVEPERYTSSPNVSVLVVPDMAHIHNFAKSRTILWDEIVEFAGRSKGRNHHQVER